MTDWIDNLERLRKLKDDGHLSAAEYEAAKERVLDRKSSHAQHPERSKVDEENVVSEESRIHLADVDDANGAMDATDFTSDGDASPRARKLGALLMLVGVLIIGLVYQAGGLDKLRHAFGGALVSSSLTNQCIGLGFGDQVMRPTDISFGSYIDTLSSDAFKNPLAPSTNDELHWDDEGGGLFVLTIITTDELAQQKTTKKQSFQLVSGNDDLKTCGPDTLAFQREVVDGQDTTQNGMQNIILTLAFAASQQQTSSSGPKSSVATPNPQSSAIQSSLSIASSSPDVLTEDELAKTRGPVHLIAGSWVPEDEYCASGAGMTLKPGGKWENEDEEGSWQFENDFLYLKKADQTVDEGSTDWPSGDEFRVTWQDGSSMRWRRCSRDGSKEPWFPNVRQVQ